MTTAEPRGLFRVGTVVGTHGLRGDLRVRTENPDSTSLATAETVTLRAADGREREHVPCRATPHKGVWLLRLRGLESIEAVQGLVGCEVLMPLAELPETGDDEFYWHQLEGLEVIDRGRGALGTVTGLLTTAAHDIYVVEGPFGEVLIPAVGAFVLAVDPAAGRIEVDLPEGLVPDGDDL